MGPPGGPGGLGPNLAPMRHVSRETLSEPGSSSEVSSSKAGMKKNGKTPQGPENVPSRISWQGHSSMASVPQRAESGDPGNFRAAQDCSN